MSSMDHTLSLTPTALTASVALGGGPWLAALPQLAVSAVPLPATCQPQTPRMCGVSLTVNEAIPRRGRSRRCSALNVVPTEFTHEEKHRDH